MNCVRKLPAHELVIGLRVVVGSVIRMGPIVGSLRDRFDKLLGAQQSDPPWSQHAQDVFPRDGKLRRFGNPNAIGYVVSHLDRMSIGVLDEESLAEQLSIGSCLAGLARFDGIRCLKIDDQLARLAEIDQDVDPVAG